MNSFTPFIALVLRVFSFDQISSYRRILFFKDRDSDTGLYSRNGVLDFYSAANIASATVAANTIGDGLLTRSAAGAVTGSVNDAPSFAFVDTPGPSVCRSRATIALLAVGLAGLGVRRRAA